MRVALLRDVNIGFYQSASALNSLEQWQRQISENMAAGSIAGYKKAGTAFESFALGSLPTSTQSTAPGQIPGNLPVSTESVDFSNGGMVNTKNPLDFAIQGNGFFGVQQNNGETLYTRNGQFHLDVEGNLVNNQGGVLLSPGGRPITVDPEGGPISSNNQGELMQDGEVFSSFMITEFVNPQNLIRSGGGFVVGDEDPEGTEIEFPIVMQGYTEESNINPVIEMVNLIEISRAFEANQKVIQSYDDRSSKAIQALGATR